MYRGGKTIAVLFFLRKVFSLLPPPPEFISVNGKNVFFFCAVAMFRVCLVTGFSFSASGLNFAVLPFAECFRYVTPSKGEGLLCPIETIVEGSKKIAF